MTSHLRRIYLQNKSYTNHGTNSKIREIRVVVLKIVNTDPYANSCTCCIDSAFCSATWSSDAGNTGWRVTRRIPALGNNRINGRRRDLVLVFFFSLPVCFCFALLTRLLSLKKGHNPTYSIKILVQSVVAAPRHRSLGSLSCNQKARNWSQFPSLCREEEEQQQQDDDDDENIQWGWWNSSNIHPSSLLQMTIWLSSIHHHSFGWQDDSHPSFRWQFEFIHPSSRLQMTIWSHSSIITPSDDNLISFIHPSIHPSLLL